MNGAPDMLKAALWYARRGWHVFPCHEPLFNDPRGYLCTCEQWRHSDDCRTRRPDLFLGAGEHCANPGKHPRGVQHGKDDATTDEAQIKRWWAKYPTANIGCVPGRAGYAVLDADTWKDAYAGADMLTDAEQETPTTLTGRGAHLWYKKHEGATYSNAPGTLPNGVDVRSDGGYVILPPSLHSSGRRYQWEDGYGPHEIEAQTLPQRIHDILTAATANTAKHRTSFSQSAKWDGTPSTQPPALDAWQLSADVCGLIAKGAPKGKRSEADMRVCVALVYAGAADDDILAVFEHHPIGTAGKFAEAGRRYLERTIGRARDYADSHPPPVPIGPLVAHLRGWLHSINLADFVPLEKQCANGYRTRERDLAVADAILEIFEGYGKASGPLGLRQLRRAANLGGLMTAARALECLAPWFVQPIEADGGAAADAAHVYELSPAIVQMGAQLVRTWDTKHKGGDYPGVSCTHKTFSEYRAHDGFNATTTPITTAMIEERAAAGCPYSAKYTTTGIYRRRLAAALPGAGRTALVIVDALVEAGGSAQLGELVGLGGRSRHTIGRAVGRLADLHLVEMDGGAVTLRPDWRDWLDNITELMPTHGNGRRRLVRDAVATLQGCAEREAEAAKTGGTVPDWCARRKERAERELQRLAPVYWRLQKHIGAVPTGRIHTGPNGKLLVEQLPELRAMAYARG